MNRVQTKKRSTSGFALMEVLIVLASVAVLIAIAIPVFNSQLDNARLSTDVANVKSAYAEYVMECVSQEPQVSPTVSGFESRAKSACEQGSTVSVGASSVTLTGPGASGTKSFTVELGQ